MEKRIKKYLNKTEKGFHFVNFGSERHGRASFRLWVNNKLINKDEEEKEFIEFPIKAVITRTDKGNYVLRPADDVTTLMVGRESGYRGKSDYKVLKGEVVNSVNFEEWGSPQGSLGISTYGLISFRGDFIDVKEVADGRLYGNDEVYYKRYYADGRVEHIPPCHDDEELCELL
jgi:hypothetical protein